LRRPTYSSISFGRFPADWTRVGPAISSGIVVVAPCVRIDAAAAWRHRVSIARSSHTRLATTIRSSGNRGRYFQYRPSN
jgi:hypothetical protein